MERTLTARFAGDSIEVLCIFKRIKNVHLKVYPDGRTVLTAPMRTETEWIQNFIDSKSEWIFRARKRYAAAERPEAGKICLFGELREVVSEQGKTLVELSGDRLVVRLPSPDPAAVERRVERFVKETAERYFAERVDALYPIVQAHGAPYPILGVRRMKSMWGNCNKHLHTIRFNTVLLSADPECIDYVVLHELTHLLIAGHQQDFKRFLETEMPDWSRRRKRLNGKFAKYL